MLKAGAWFLAVILALNLAAYAFRGLEEQDVTTEEKAAREAAAREEKAQREEARRKREVERIAPRLRSLELAVVELEAKGEDSDALRRDCSQDFLKMAYEAEAGGDDETEVAAREAARQCWQFTLTPRQAKWLKESLTIRRKVPEALDEFKRYSVQEAEQGNVGSGEAIVLISMCHTEIVGKLAYLLEEKRTNMIAMAAGSEEDARFLKALSEAETAFLSKQSERCDQLFSR